jgi:hypothetical protein
MPERIAYHRRPPRRPRLHDGGHGSAGLNRLFACQRSAESGVLLLQLQCPVAPEPGCGFGVYREI